MHLTYDIRCQIDTLLAIGKSHREIAKIVGVHHSTISREISRNKSDQNYCFQKAHEKATNRRKSAVSGRYVLTADLESRVKTMLCGVQASPQQISGRLKKEGFSISHESIYKMIWKDKKNGGDLYKNLRHRGKKYNKRGGKTAGRGVIPNRRDIAERPAIVAKKKRFGDLEIDTIVGARHKGAILSIVDRATKHTKLILLERGTAENVIIGMEKALSGFINNLPIHTITSDNGKEFSGHEKIAKDLGADFYFATPYHSWERGLNEHTNGLVRQYFPKGTNFSTLTQEMVSEVEKTINNRPRAILNFDTPRERLLAVCPDDAGVAFHA